ncbi:PAS domain-containing protein, partial [Acinetobacter baumannii]
ENKKDSFCVLGFSLTSLPETAASQRELNWATAHVLLPKQLRSTILAEAMPHFVWCVNVDIDCEFANKLFCDYTGWQEDDFKGKK